MRCPFTKTKISTQTKPHQTQTQHTHRHILTMTISAQQLEKFNNLVASSIDDQSEFFLKSFIFALEENWKEVPQIATKFKKTLTEAGESGEQMNEATAASFLQANGRTRTALQRRDEIRDIDLDDNKQISFIEYLLLHYKGMILSEYYKRMEQTPTENLENFAIGVTGVGEKLLDELFTLPVGLDPALERAIEEFTATKKARETRLKDLEAKASQGGVKGIAAKNEIAQMASEDVTEMNRMEISLNSAKKRGAKQSGEVALAEKKKVEEEEQKKKLEDGRNAMKNRAALWESK